MYLHRHKHGHEHRHKHIHNINMYVYTHTQESRSESRSWRSSSFAIPSRPINHTRNSDTIKCGPGTASSLHCNVVAALHCNGCIATLQRPCRSRRACARLLYATRKATPQFRERVALLSDARIPSSIQSPLSERTCARLPAPGAS